MAPRSNLKYLFLFFFLPKRQLVASDYTNTDVFRYQSFDNVCEVWLQPMVLWVNSPTQQAHLKPNWLLLLPLPCSDKSLRRFF